MSRVYGHEPPVIHKLDPDLWGADLPRQCSSCAHYWESAKPDEAHMWSICKRLHGNTLPDMGRECLVWEKGEVVWVRENDERG